MAANKTAEIIMEKLSQKINLLLIHTHTYNGDDLLNDIITVFNQQTSTLQKENEEKDARILELEKSLKYCHGRMAEYVNEIERLNEKLKQFV